MTEQRLYASLNTDKLKEDYVKCQACIRGCIIAQKESGVCGNRENIEGRLEDKLFPNIIIVNEHSTLGEKPILYLKDKAGEIASANTPVLSIGGYECNLRCKECPNPSMSHPKLQAIKTALYLAPNEVIKRARNKGIKYLALTYNEFVCSPQTAMELTALASAEGIETILVTNTTCTPEFLNLFHENGGNIARLDLKSSLMQANQFYKEYCGLEIKKDGKVITIDKILETIKHAKDLGLHIEIASAITPMGYVPSNFVCWREFQQTAEWIKEELGSETPWHLALLHPARKNIDLGINMIRIKYYAMIAKESGLNNVTTTTKMCDCIEKELFPEDVGQKRCC